MNKSILFIRKIIERQEDAQISAHAGNATFFLTLSVFPFIMLLVSIMRLFFSSADELIHNNLIVVPEIIRPLCYSILDEIYAVDASPVLSISAVLSLYSASRGIRAMILGINVVHHSKWNKSFLYQSFVGIIYTLTILVAIILVLSLLVFGNRIYQALGNTFPVIKDLHEGIASIRYLFMALFLFLIFSLVYTIAPNKSIRFVTQFPAALFTTAGWLISSYIFSFYADHFGNYSYTYGSLAMIILLMVWCYFLMYLFFLGSVLGAVCSETFKKD